MMSDLEKLLNITYDEDEIKAFQKPMMQASLPKMDYTLEELKDLWKIAEKKFEISGTFSVHFKDHEAWLETHRPVWERKTRCGNKIIDFIIPLDDYLNIGTNAKSWTTQSNDSSHTDKVGEFGKRVHELDKMDISQWPEHVYHSFYIPRMKEQLLLEFGISNMFYHVLWCEQDTHTIYINDFQAASDGQVQLESNTHNSATFLVGNMRYNFYKPKSVLQRTFLVDRTDPRQFRR